MAGDANSAALASGSAARPVPALGVGHANEEGGCLTYVGWKGPVFTAGSAAYHLSAYEPAESVNVPVSIFWLSAPVAVYVYSPTANAGSDNRVTSHAHAPFASAMASQARV